MNRELNSAASSCIWMMAKVCVSCVKSLNSRNNILTKELINIINYIENLSATLADDAPLTNIYEELKGLNVLGVFSKDELVIDTWKRFCEQLANELNMPIIYGVFYIEFADINPLPVSLSEEEYLKLGLKLGYVITEKKGVFSKKTKHTLNNCITEV